MIHKHSDIADRMLAWGREGEKDDIVREMLNAHDWTPVDRVVLVRATQALERIAVLLDPAERQRIREAQLAAERDEKSKHYSAAKHRAILNFINELSPRPSSTVRAHLREYVYGYLMDRVSNPWSDELPELSVYREEVRAALAALRWPAQIAKVGTRKQARYAQWHREVKRENEVLTNTSRKE